MSDDQFFTGLIALIAGYLFGSIPTAYLVTRKVRGEDIRKLGGGNVGSLNVYREVGTGPALLVLIVDLSKGAAAVATAHHLLGLTPFFVFLAGLATVIGHNWMVWLKFTGGRGMGATVGTLALIMPLYGYWQGFAIFISIALILYAITRNVSLSLGAGLLFLPAIVWTGTGSLTATIFSVLLAAIALLKSWRMFRNAWKKNRNPKDFIFDRWHRK